MTVNNARQVSSTMFDTVRSPIRNWKDRLLKDSPGKNNHPSLSVLSCTILCSTAFCWLSNDSQRRITQRIDDVDGAAYRLHGQKLAGIAFNREWNNVGETASAAAAGNR